MLVSKKKNQKEKAVSAGATNIKGKDTYFSSFDVKLQPYSLLKTIWSSFPYTAVLLSDILNTVHNSVEEQVI